MSLFGFLFGGGTQSDRIDGARARALVDEGATLLDVRTGAEFRSGHVDGAINIPVAEIDRANGVVAKDKPVVVYCRSGARSARAAMRMRTLGFGEVHDLGSIANW
jgi:rhodanese-related sulfurtransferase